MLNESFIFESSQEVKQPTSKRDTVSLYLHYTEQPSGRTQQIFYFLFVNPKSGNKQGKQYLTVGNRTIQFLFGDQNVVSVVKIFDLFDNDISDAFIKIKQITEKFEGGNQKFRIIVCGGDGTINWVLTQALDAQIDFDRVSFGILPIGTGNDFSRSLGWGYKTITFSREKLSALRRIVKLWNEADEDYYDIWDITIRTQRSGHFFDIKNQHQRKIQKNVITKSFTNYIGIGLDARIVYDVERNRGRNALLTKIMYSVIGTLNYCRHLRPIDEYIYSFQQIPQENVKDWFEEEDMMQRSFEKSFETKGESKIQSFETIEASKIDQSNGNISEKDYTVGMLTPFRQKYQLQRSQRGLVCLNCSSYMSGIRNVWQTPKKINKVEMQYSPQKTNDGLLEFMTFQDQLSLALERISRRGAKLTQGRGPFFIQFKTVLKGQQQTFMEVDGESLKVINIESILIEKSKKFKDGKIKVLKRKMVD